MADAIAIPNDALVLLDASMCDAIADCRSDTFSVVHLWFRECHSGLTIRLKLPPDTDLEDAIDSLRTIANLFVTIFDAEVDQDDDCGLDGTTLGAVCADLMDIRSQTTFHFVQMYRSGQNPRRFDLTGERKLRISHGTAWNRE